MLCFKVIQKKFINLCDAYLLIAQEVHDHSYVVCMEEDLPESWSGSYYVNTDDLAYAKQVFTDIATEYEEEYEQGLKNQAERLGTTREAVETMIQSMTS